jgi:hypothetical protein
METKSVWGTTFETDFQFEGDRRGCLKELEESDWGDPGAQDRPVVGHELAGRYSSCHVDILIFLRGVII